AASSRPNCSSSRVAVARASAERRPCRRPNSQRFSVAVRSSSTDAYCPVTPSSWRTRCGSRATSTPNREARPSSIGNSVASILSIVVLPAPFGPRTPKISPWRTSRSIPSTARKSPNDLTNPVASTAVVGVISSLPSDLGCGAMRTVSSRGFTTATWRFRAITRPGGGCSEHLDQPVFPWRQQVTRDERGRFFLGSVVEADDLATRRLVEGGAGLEDHFRLAGYL